jgi:hypothetical protein
MRILRRQQTTYALSIVLSLLGVTFIIFTIWKTWPTVSSACNGSMFLEKSPGFGVPSATKIGSHPETRHSCIVLIAANSFIQLSLKKDSDTVDTSLKLPRVGRAGNGICTLHLLKIPCDSHLSFPPLCWARARSVKYGFRQPINAW